MSRLKTYFTLLFVAGLGGLGACSGSHETEATVHTVAVPEGVTTLVAGLSTVPREILFNGTLEAVNQATVSAQTSGRILELPFDVGDYVEQGAVIVRITDIEQQARVDQATSQLAEAEAMQSEAQVTHDRTQEIFSRQLSARADYDRAVTALEAAKARVEVARAALAEARQNLDYTVLTAPYAGLLVERHVQVGETVAPGTALLTGLSLQNLRAVVDVPQQHIGPLRVNQMARVVLPDGQSVDASNLRIPPAADAATQSFRVLVELPELEQAVFPGTLVKVGFVTGEEEATLIPESALVRRGEVTAVYLDVDNSLVMRYVRTGPVLSDGQVPVESGLQGGEVVVLDTAAAAQAMAEANAGGGEAP